MKRRRDERIGARPSAWQVEGSGLRLEHLSSRV